MTQQSPAPAPAVAPARSGARTAWIAIGGIVLVLACGFVGFPFFGALFGFPLRVGVAFALTLAAWAVFIGVYVAGLRLARPSAVPPAIAALLIGAGGVVATMWLIPTLAAW